MAFESDPSLIISSSFSVVIVTALLYLNYSAKEAGIIIINEVGLDPGLDHMSAMKIIDDVKARGGTIRSFKSVCGGLPAPEAADNPLKYKFSWSPKGVITASQNAARFRWNGEIVEVSTLGFFCFCRYFVCSSVNELALNVSLF